MANRVEFIIRDAVRQGWRLLAGGKHQKLWTPDGKRFKTVPFDRYGGREEHAFERDMIKLGWKPQSEIKAEEKQREKSVASVQDLIKANGTGQPVETKPPPEPVAAKAKRMSRVGIDRDILAALKGVFPHELDVTTLMMKVALNHPGVKQPMLYSYLSKLKAANKIINSRMGYYRLANADVAVAPLTEAQVEPLQHVVPGEVKLVIDQLVSAVDAAEKLMVRLSRQLAEQTEAAETIKRLAAKL